MSDYKDKIVRKTLDIPKGLHAKLKAIADKEERKFHGFVIRILKKFITDNGK